MAIKIAKKEGTAIVAANVPRIEPILVGSVSRDANIMIVVKYTGWVRGK